jgi:peptidoglycan/LPS O-acetylase OafA/YrhL
MIGKKHSYVPAFDGLRTLCIVGVVVFHVTSTDRVWLHNLATRGWYGVDVFFVLSGFLITWILLNELREHETIDLPRFYIRRALRLQPAFFSGLIVMMIITGLFLPDRFKTIVHELPWFLTYTLNIGLAWGITHPLYEVTWSLCIEEQFYLFWPWALRRLGQTRGLLFVAAAVIGICVYRTVLYGWMNWGHLTTPSEYSVARLYYATDTRVDTIFLGCALALALNTRRFEPVFDRIRTWNWFPTVAVAAALVAIAWGTSGGHPNGNWRSLSFGSTLMSATVAAVVLALFLHPTSWPSRLLSTRPLVYVGKISYGIYLFHVPVWMAISVPMGLRHGKLGTLPQETIAICATLILSVVVAALHYNLVEKRFLSMRERVPKLREPVRERALADMTPAA